MKTISLILGLVAVALGVVGCPDSGADHPTPDAGLPDAGLPDAGLPDAGLPDAENPDAGLPDAGPDPDGIVTPPPRWFESTVTFATIPECEALLGASDSYSVEQSAFDRGIRMQTLSPTTEADYLGFAASQCAAWSEEVRQLWEDAAAAVAEALQGLALEAPAEILIVTTTGAEEFGAAYTRANAIILPARLLWLPSEYRIGLLAHELWHVASRHQPAVRDDVFPLLGFEPFMGATYPASLERRRVTNPDAFSLDHYLAVQAPAGARDVVPILQATVPLDVALEIDPFSAFGTFLLAVDVATGDLIDPTPIAAEETDYFTLASVNTTYTIHPEEVAADNFSFLLQRRLPFLTVTVDDPTVLDRFEALLTSP